MEGPLKIEAPAGYVPLHAVSWVAAAGDVLPASLAAPLPVQAQRPTPVAALTGTAPAAKLAGPFASEPGRVTYLTLSGSWSGTVRLLRSAPGSAARHPLTLGGQEWGVFTGNVCEAVWDESEAGAALWLDCAPSGGVIAYRLAQ